MNAVEIIARKRDGQSLSEQDLAWMVSSFASGSVPDYQMASFAMAVFLQGMDAAETANLTREMLESGIRLEHVDDGRPVVDKHSTGGIGDKTSLVLAPLLACCDLRVPMLSGRGLGPTGGTLDKLEAIPGFRTNLSVEELKTVVQDVGCVITGASEQLAPADRKLYALRDVTATVPSVPLITSSIMSKKLAESLDALVLDVKVGSGAFMKSLDDARTLALSLVRTGTDMGLATTALLTDMNQPLGRMVGNAVEVLECADFLRGEEVPGDLKELTYALASQVLIATGTPTADARGILEDHISSGRAWERFERMVVAQGGSARLDLKVAQAVELGSVCSGVVTRVDGEQIGLAIIDMGGGRKKKTDDLDHSTGIEMLVRVGDTVEEGQPLCRLFADTSASAVNGVRERLQSAIVVSDEPADAYSLIVETITAES